MLRFGVEPFLECSSKGDKRFSAFYARLKSMGNQSIEELYQAFKIMEDGSTGLTWKEAKGRKAINQEDACIYYSHLWDEYLDENPGFMKELKQYGGFSDVFGQKGHCCQAEELYRIVFGPKEPKTNLDKIIEDIAEESARQATLNM